MLAKRGARVVIPARRAKATKDVRARIVAECPAADVLMLPRLLLSLFSPSCFLRHTSLCARCACLSALSTDHVVPCVCGTMVTTHHTHVCVCACDVTREGAIRDREEGANSVQLGGVVSSFPILKGLRIRCLQIRG
jgi:hypothetical protein